MEYKTRYGLTIPNHENGVIVKYIEPERKSNIMKALICLLGFLLTLTFVVSLIINVVPENWSVLLSFFGGMAAGGLWTSIYEMWRIE